VFNLAIITSIFARRDVNQFGNLAAIDRIILEQPTVGLDFTYLLTDMANEKNLGFTINATGTGIIDITSPAATGSCLAGILTSGFVNTKNYFIRTVSEGNDASAFSADSAANITPGSTIGLGNGFLTNYSINAAVGDFPTVSVSLELFKHEFQQWKFRCCSRRNFCWKHCWRNIRSTSSCN